MGVEEGGERVVSRPLPSAHWSTPTIPPPSKETTATRSVLKKMAVWMPPKAHSTFKKVFLIHTNITEVTHSNMTSGPHLTQNDFNYKGFWISRTSPKKHVNITTMLVIGGFQGPLMEGGCF